MKYTPPSLSAAAAAATGIAAIAAALPINDRDCIFSGLTATVSSRTVPAFLPVPSSSLTAVLTAAGTPFKYMISGVTYTISSNAKTILCANGWNRISINAAGTLAIETAWPKTKPTAPSGPSSGDLWHDLQTGLMKKYDGAAWNAYPVIMIGCIYATGSVITRCGNVPFGWTPTRIRQEFGDASDGSHTATGSTVNDTGGMYSEFLRSSTGVLTHTASLQASVPVIRSQGPICFVDTAAVTLTGLGRAGGAAIVSAATNGTAGVGGHIGGSGGGGGGGVANTGGTGGSSLRGIPTANTANGGTAGTAGNAGGNAGALANTPASADDPIAACGIGNSGAAGGGVVGFNSGAGGAGAGGFVFKGLFYVIDTGSALAANGSDGGAGTGAGAGGGGGGGGGMCASIAGSVQDHNGSTHTAAGGASGAAGGAGAGAGGTGRAGVWLVRELAA